MYNFPAEHPMALWIKRKGTNWSIHEPGYKVWSSTCLYLQSRITIFRIFCHLCGTIVFSLDQGKPKVDDQTLNIRRFWSSVTPSFKKKKNKGIVVLSLFTQTIALVVVEVQADIHPWWISGRFFSSLGLRHTEDLCVGISCEIKRFNNNTPAARDEYVNLRSGSEIKFRPITSGISFIRVGLSTNQKPPLWPCGGLPSA